MAVQVEIAKIEDLPLFTEMEQEADTRGFIVPCNLEEHIKHYSKSDVVYLRILENRKLAGFIFLVLEPDGKSVEFRRIVVTTSSRGIGQKSILAMEDYCRNVLYRLRIWLDVFGDNKRARHIYEKTGYHRFGESEYGDKQLLLYEKKL